MKMQRRGQREGWPQQRGAVRPGRRHGRSAYRKDIVATIRKNLKRFVSLAVICALGVAMFSTLQVSTIDLRHAADEFFDKQNLYDIKVLSTLGLGDSDIQALASVDGVELAEGGYSESTYAEVGDGRMSVDVRARSESGMNDPMMLEGRLPKRKGEVAVTQEFVDKTGLWAGDTVELVEPEDPDSAVFERVPYTIVGIMIDPLDINNPELSFRSGSSSDCSFVVDEDAVTSDAYTVAYLKVEGAEGIMAYDQEYTDAVAPVLATLEDKVIEDRAEARTAEVRGEAQAELDDARAEYESQKADAEAELAASKAKLDDAAGELASGQAELDQKKQQLSEKQQQLDEGWDAYNKASAALEEQAQWLAGEEKAVAEKGSEILAQWVPALKEAIDRAPASIDELLEILNDSNLEQDILDYLDRHNINRDTLEQLRTDVESLVKREAAVVIAKPQIEDARTQLASARTQLEQGQAALPLAQQMIDAGQGKLDSGRSAYEDGMRDWQQGKSEADARFADAEAEFSDAQAEIDDIEAASWYVQGRDSLPCFSSVRSDADSIEAIGKLFPAVFIVVAVLVSLTTITRMVEEERGLIGTYKALGYRNREIYLKYLAYALLACLVGSAFGFLIGFVLIPLFIFQIFGLMYLLPSYPLMFDWAYAAASVAVFLVAIAGTAAVACAGEVRQMPATLMRPKAPKSGSRILLEHIRPIWSRLSFLNKVTARNLFRYKRRFLMTVAGVLGCTALIVCGFTIRDSVAELIPLQYDHLVRYDIMAVANEGDLDGLLGELSSDKRVEAVDAAYLDNVTLTTDAGEETVQLIVLPDSVDLSRYLALEDRDSGKALSLPDEGAIITRNASEVLAFSAGDTVRAQESDLDTAEFEVEGIAANYLGNYIYMSEGAYEAAFGAVPQLNTVLLRAEGGELGHAAGDLADELSGDARVLTVVDTASNRIGFDKAFVLINAIVVILLGMAAALAFAVLFTLSTTNISERERELATIKVLGFRPREVHRYLNKETIILTLIGIVCGLPFGCLLGDVLLQSLKMPSISFLTTVEPLSLAISAVMPFLFALIVDAITNRTLDRIDMIEALKSVE